MIWLIITPEKLTEMEAINDAHPYQKMNYRVAADGTMLTPSNKVGDTYWADWQDWLNSLTPLEGNPVWPKPKSVDPTNQS